MIGAATHRVPARVVTAVAGAWPRDTGAVIADLHAGAGNLLELARAWRSVPPSAARIEDASRILTGLERVLGELRAALPAAVASAIDWSTLTLVNAHFVDDALAVRESDLLYTAKVGGAEVLLYVLFEHLCGAPHKCSYAEPTIMLRDAIAATES